MCFGLSSETDDALGLSVPFCFADMGVAEGDDRVKAEEGEEGDREGAAEVGDGVAEAEVGVINFDSGVTDALALKTALVAALVEVLKASALAAAEGVLGPV